MALQESEYKQYDRQLRLWGMDAQKALKLASVCIIGTKTVCTELARHLNLAGVKLTFVSDREELVEPHSLQEDFLFREEHVGKTKLEVLKNELMEINPHNCVNTLKVSSMQDLTADFFKAQNFSVVISAFTFPKECKFINSETRKAKIPFYFMHSCGPYGFAYCDLGTDEFSYKWQIPQGSFGKAKKKEGEEVKGKEAEVDQEHTEERKVTNSVDFASFIATEATKQLRLTKRQ